ncbi:MAG: proline dehydrogenase [Balneolaceae bacterium]|nr:MAG: proline dehydrogenase [Balneolaceae bacterium]
MKLPFNLAKRFVAGEDFVSAAPKVSELNELDIKVTLDLLGENVRDRKQADSNLQHYTDLLDGIHETGLESSISIKLTMLGLDIDNTYCHDNLFRLLDVARKQNQFVRIDMEGTDYTQSTIDLFRDAHAEYGSSTVGIVIQAYLHRSVQDIPDLAALGADIRLCKGAYSEPAKLALQQMPAIRDAYKKFAAHLLEHTAFPRMASHDDELINWVKEYTTEKNIPKDRFEFQMLYGLRLNTCRELVSEGYRVRVYVPYGTEWLPYFTRRLRERKENVWFVLSTMFKN